MLKSLIIVSMALLAACASCPTPPVVDGSERQQVNSRETSEILELRAQLARVEDKLREQSAMPTIIVKPVVPSVRSETISVQFPYNDTNFNPTPAQLATLLPLLKDAQRIEVRGRTDNQSPGAPDEQVALNRALAAKRFLVAQGVSPLIVSINYLSAGDYVADNCTEAGKSHNRRVEIEVFNK